MSLESGAGRIPPQIVLAILTVDGRYALQHRDEAPGVAYPGHWSLFGGAVDPGEAAAAAIRREVREELDLDIAAWRELWRFAHWSGWKQALLRYAVFAADVTGLWPSHRVREGQGVGLFALDALPRPLTPVAGALLERYAATVSRPGPPPAPSP